MRFCKEAMAVLGSIQFPDNVHKEQFEANARPFETGARSCEADGNGVLYIGGSVNWEDLCLLTCGRERKGL